MTSIVDIKLPIDETSLGDVSDTVPTLSCEMEQVISSRNRTLWLSGTDLPVLESALDDASTVRSYQRVGSGDGRWLFDIDFDQDIVDIFEIVQSTDGTVLSASATNGSWQLRVRVVEREALRTLYDRFRSVDITPEIVRLYDPTTEMHSRYGMTNQQYETLLAAIDHGYFEIPREISMQELSDELGVSHQALSERLRRAYQALVTAELENADSRTPSKSVPTN
ncbi:helix-turn-helix domain-containing protein [Halostagnicola sp. A-GB9-2]|uniref:helix-turn-helix domain-containing protein n=1 Tax=Halostagnicola sp. A-GB9-2 TaxID=3048066 RepID=UPI0024C089B2|nr:helix-turn-helix domain-containing protein [Halostagnicola sp. A-GB9-2]MDJ1433456.1 helix-turn-helix domain-containing protein [Halostagnicola sp. A-GB9-2]